MNLESTNTIKISGVDVSSQITGANFAKLTNGSGSFDSLSLAHAPGAEMIEFELYSLAIDESKVINGLNLTAQLYSDYYYSAIFVDFRYWEPGETSADNDTIWQICAYATYSFNWNSSECTTCMDDAT